MLFTYICFHTLVIRPRNHTQRYVWIPREDESVEALEWNVRTRACRIKVLRVAYPYRTEPKEQDFRLLLVFCHTANECWSLLVVATAKL